ncbi:MAG TPA: putative lipid II flippase FtsW [Acidimicrobiia bacterium]|nr:putative lipid II flippase FtsW [Acidimicrobiia bacterium]
MTSRRPPPARSPSRARAAPARRTGATSTGNGTAGKGRKTGSPRRSAARRPSVRLTGVAAVLVATIVVLNVVGLVMIMSASSVTALENYGSSWAFFTRQLLFTAIGVVAFLVASRFDYRRLARLAGPLLVVTVGLLLLVFVPGLGVHVSGSSRWISLGPFNLQPSELAKLAVLVFGADVLARRADLVDDWRLALRPVLLVFGGLALIVMKQPDMGTTIVLAIIVATLLFAGGVPVRHLLPIGGAGLAAAVILAFSAPYRRARVLSFLDPFSDPGNTGYQAVQSLIAFGSGGLFGVGLGAGRAKWLFLPNAHTDFIFSIIGEELGLVGALFVVALFVAFAVLGLRTAARARDRFGFLLATAITVWIVGQAVINMGAAIGLLPVTGVPMPFVSFGGSALVTVMAASGVLVNIAKQSVELERREPVAARAT